MVKFNKIIKTIVVKDGIWINIKENAYNNRYINIKQQKTILIKDIPDLVESLIKISKEW